MDHKCYILSITDSERFMELYETFTTSPGTPMELIELLGLIQITYDVPKERFPLCGLFNSILRNIVYGDSSTVSTWDVHPAVWVSLVAASGRVTPGTKNDWDSYVEICGILSKRKCIYGRLPKKMKLKWLRNPTGLKDILAAGKALIDVTKTPLQER